LGMGMLSNLGVPTVLDRLFQRSLIQVLQPILERGVLGYTAHPLDDHKPV
jgi:retron-type reverse transcriptase